MVGFLFLIIVFFQTSIQKISSRNVKSELQSYQKNEMEFLKSKKEFREWQKVNSSYFRFTRNFFFRFGKFSAFRRNFEMRLTKNSLHVSGLNYAIEKIDNELVKVMIGFQAKGLYQNLKRFIFEIENIAKIVFFKEIHMTKNKDDLEAKINLEAYFVR